MFNLRPIAFINGILVATLASAMILPAIVDLGLGNPDWAVFATAGGAALFMGVGMAMATRGTTELLTIRSAFIMTTVAWVLLAAFGALPFVWSELDMSYTDAFFEAMSGLTTTGATVIVGLDAAPPGILLWRGLLQWLGGLGIIVMAIAVLPMLQIGGMQLFRIEAFDTSEKILPRATQISGTLSMLYLLFTIICAVAYHIAGMRVLDAVIHAMTTIATGGFSSHDASMGYFDSTAIEIIAITFMIIGSMPFILYIKMMQGSWRALFRNSQVRAFLGTLCFFSLLAFIAQGQSEYGVEHGFREAVFNVVSIMTGTGYATVAYDNWGSLAIALFFCLMFVGGCAGSTSCGIKIFRFQVLYLAVKQHMNRILYPSGVFVPTYEDRPLSDTVMSSVSTFFFLYFLSVAFFAFLLTFEGIDALTALSASATAVSNVGPGLGRIIGPAGTFAPLSDTAKWTLSVAMLIGRLELFTVFVLFTRAFWRG